MSLTYVGEIRIFAGNFPPAGWEFCEGQLLPIMEYETLFNLLGTTYGGDGQETFALPDLQGRSPMHKGPNHRLAEDGAIGFRDAFPSQSAADTQARTAGSYLAMSFIISLFGVFPVRDGGRSDTEPFLAEGKIFSFDFAPTGWATCDGQFLPINQNQALFALLGTTYGGNGQTNFALPDLRGSIPIYRPDELGGRIGEEDSETAGTAVGRNEVSLNFLVLNFCIALQGIFPSRD